MQYYDLWVMKRLLVVVLWPSLKVDYPVGWLSSHQDCWYQDKSPQDIMRAQQESTIVFCICCHCYHVSIIRKIAAHFSSFLCVFFPLYLLSLLLKYQSDWYCTSISNSCFHPIHSTCLSCSSWWFTGLSQWPGWSSRRWSAVKRLLVVVEWLLFWWISNSDSCHPNGNINLCVTTLMIP